jgi:hypothetical protein
MLHCPKTVARTIVYSGVFLATGISTALAADPTGDWKVADGVANIRVAQCNGNIWGAVSWEKTPGDCGQSQKRQIRSVDQGSGHRPDRTGIDLAPSESPHRSRWFSAHERVAR